MPNLVIPLCIAHEDGVAFLTLAAILDVQNGEALIFGCRNRVETLWIALIGINEFVVRLQGADTMEKNLVIVILRGEFVALFGRLVPAVIKAVSLPSQIRHFDPTDDIVEHFPRGDLHDMDFSPIGSSCGEAISEILAVLRK